jgi:hypothetical protein
MITTSALSRKEFTNSGKNRSTVLNGEPAKQMTRSVPTSLDAAFRRKLQKSENVGRHKPGAYSTFSRLELQPDS